MYKGIQPYLQVQATLAAVVRLTVNPTTAAKVACTFRHGCIPSSIRNSSGTQNAKIHPSFSRHLRAILTDGGWLRQSYINTVTQVFYVKKIEEIIEYTNLIGFSKNMKKNMIKIRDKNK